MAINLSIPTPNVSSLTLSGAKTYLVAAAAVAYAAYGLYTHQMTTDEAAGFILSGAGGAAVRAAIAKISAFAADHADAIDAARAEVVQLRGLVQALQVQVAAAPVKVVVAPPAPPPAPPQGS